MTSPSKKAAIQEEWERVNESIDSLLSQLDPDYVELGTEQKDEGFFCSKVYRKELDAFIAYEYKRAKAKDGGVLDFVEFSKKMKDGYIHHYRYRATRNSIMCLKAFFNFLCQKKNNTISAAQMWPENANPILSQTVVNFLRKCSENFDKKSKKV